MYYDPMIAKLVTHAPTREAAIDAQAEALDAFYIDGIQHNVPFLTALMQHPRWRKGALSTGFIKEEYPDGFQARQPAGAEQDVLSAVAAAIDHASNLRRRTISHQMDHALRFAHRRVVDLGGAQRLVEVTGGHDAPVQVTFFDATTGGRGQSIEIKSSWWPGVPVWEGIVAGRPASIQVRAILNGSELSYRGIRTLARVYTEREAALVALMPEKKAADTSKLLLCPMPGLVVSIAVEMGQEVKAGETLCTVEAMKMQNILRAERDGKVKVIKAKAGDSLAVDAVIMEFS